MQFITRMTLGFLICLSSFASSISKPQSIVYQMFWHPMFHGERLNYCNESKSCCGKEIAARYCAMLGFNDVRGFKKAANIGFTRYISGRNECQGWMCAGFDWIECVGERTYVRPPVSDFTQELFVYPRWHKFPLAWCYDDTMHHCGKKAAYAFCRWQGYGAVERFAQRDVYASKTIGSNKLCITKNCSGFDYIVCKRA